MCVCLSICVCETERKEWEKASIHNVLYCLHIHTHEVNDLLLNHTHIHRGEEDRMRSNTEAIKAVVSGC